MIDKLGGTALLLNGQAVTFIAQGKYAEADTALAEALEKDPNNPETLVNLVVLAQHQGKSQEQATRLLSQLKDLEPGHPFLQVVYQPCPSPSLSSFSLQKEIITNFAGDNIYQWNEIFQRMEQKEADFDRMVLQYSIAAWLLHFRWWRLCDERLFTFSI